MNIAKNTAVLRNIHVRISHKIETKIFFIIDNNQL